MMFSSAVRFAAPLLLVGVLRDASGCEPSDECARVRKLGVTPLPWPMPPDRVAVVERYCRVLRTEDDEFHVADAHAVRARLWVQAKSFTQRGELRPGHRQKDARYVAVRRMLSELGVDGVAEDRVQLGVAR
jgi:hypothetical protein